MAIYSDVNQTSPQTKPVLEDHEAVFQSIHNILVTASRTRLFNPGFGADLENILFEPMNRVTEIRIRDIIFQSVSKADSRVIFNTAASTIEAKPDENSYEINLVFSIRGLGEKIFEFQGSLSR